MATIFISYSRKDLTSALKLKEDLEKLKHDGWLDLEDLPAASRWRAEIERAIEERDIFLFALTPSSAVSRECRKELDHAIQLRKRIIPVVREDVAPDSVDEALNDLGWIFLRAGDDQEAGLGQIENAITTDLDHLHSHTRVLNRALDWERARRDRSRLLRGSNLAEAEQWLAASPGKKPVPTPLQEEFVRGSRHGENRRRVWQLAVASMLVAITLTAAFVAYQRRQTARDDLSRRLARDAVSAEALDRSLLLAVASHEVSQTGDAVLSLLTSLEKAPQLLSMLHGHTGEVTALAFHPREPLLASGGADGAIHLWTTGTWTSRGTLPGKEHIEKLVFSLDGKLLLSGDQAGQVRRWEPFRGMEILPPLKAPRGLVESLSLHPAGRYLGVGYSAGALLWDLGQSPPRQVVLPLAEDRRIPAVAFDPKGRRIAALEGTTTLMVWDFADGALANRHALVLASEAAALAWSPDGESIALGHHDGSITWLDAGNLQAIRHVPGSGSAILDLAFDAEGALLAAGCGDHVVRVWAENRDEPMAILPARDRVFAIAFQAGTGILASAGIDPTLYLWDPGLVQPLARQALHRPRSDIQKIVLTPEGRWLIAGDLGGRITRLDLANFGEPEDLPIETGGDLGGLAIAGDELLWSGADGFFGLWDLKNRKETLRRQAPATVSAVAFWDSGLFATGGQDGRVSLWQRDSSGGLKENPLHSDVPPVKPPDIIMDLAFSPDGKLLAAGDNSTHVYLWDAASLRRLQTWTVPNGTTNLAFSPDSRQIAVVNGGDGEITMLDPRRADVPKARSGVCKRAFSVAFREGGRFLVTGCDDGSLEQIEINPWRSLGSLRAGSDFVYSLATSRDPALTAAGTADGRVVLWDLDPASWKRRACRRVNEDLPEDIRKATSLSADLCGQLLRNAPPEPPGLRFEKQPAHLGVPENVAGG
ncbi:MAG TPA: TIR domain-containing protein [Thermoanaerobaculia bacterium]|nr:TIR domain-containing protein [Thermoanaerobaculia bacterium]